MSSILWIRSFPKAWGIWINLWPTCHLPGTWRENQAICFQSLTLIPKAKSKTNVIKPTSGKFTPEQLGQLDKLHCPGTQKPNSICKRRATNANNRHTPEELTAIWVHSGKTHSTRCTEKHIGKIGVHPKPERLLIQLEAPLAGTGCKSPQQRWAVKLKVGDPNSGYIWFDPAL